MIHLARARPSLKPVPALPAPPAASGKDLAALAPSHSLARLAGLAAGVRRWLPPLLALLLAGLPGARAAEYDWGVIAVEDETTIGFSAYDRHGNFTDDYSFSLLSGSDTAYDIAVTFDFCKNGCGNPEVSYGLYSSSGQLISDSGTAILSSGDYFLRVGVTGMGAGNSLDYAGSITFSTALVSTQQSFVAAVPEPRDVLLLLCGLSCLALGRRLRRKAHPAAA